jgi:hypothetical protein
MITEFLIVAPLSMMLRIPITALSICVSEMMHPSPTTARRNVAALTLLAGRNRGRV